MKTKISFFATNLWCVLLELLMCWFFSDAVIETRVYAEKNSNEEADNNKSV